ncbi:MAG: hydrogenase expression/formation protein HypE [Candidatus Cloacimonetes bacterium]|nr:hydrogenase expression/formation protein HypE [Candidatus Cloacimonadota bacterium]
MKDKIITLAHGSGARLTQKLISIVFAASFNMTELSDYATIEHNMVVTTDAHVIKPLFFPGGDIGRLAVTGTVNDIAVSGAVPAYLLATFIIEEGFAVSDLQKIVASMQETALEAGVRIIAGDTKVVEKHNAEGLYITTTGIGFLPPNCHLSTSKIALNDNIFINNFIGEHTIAIINSRNQLNLNPPPCSDCAPLNHLIQKMLTCSDIHFMRDATRGGIATILNEVFDDCALGIIIEESALPISSPTQAISDLLGLEPLYMANEGVIVTFAASQPRQLLSTMQNHKYGKNAARIGYVTNEVKGVYLRTSLGSLRPLPMLNADPLPRIC